MSCFRDAPPRHDEYQLAPRIPQHCHRHERLATARNITLGASPTVIQQPLTSTNRFYRGAWVP
jgi:hypothetical protein